MKILSAWASNPCSAFTVCGVFLRASTRWSSDTVGRVYSSNILQLRQVFSHNVLKQSCIMMMIIDGVVCLRIEAWCGITGTKGLRGQVRSDVLCSLYYNMNWIDFITENSPVMDSEIPHRHGGEPCIIQITACFSCSRDENKAIVTS